MKTAASLLAVIACSSDPPPDFSLTDEHTASASSNSRSTAASAAGAPDDVVNFLAHPHDSTPQERQRIAIYLEAIGVAEHCPEFTGDDARNEHTASPEEHGKLEEPVHLEPLPVNVQQFPEELRRLCQAWALENLSPVAYEEFRQLRPERMDDLDRRIWGERFNRQSLRRYRSNLAGSGEQFWHPAPGWPLDGEHRLTRPYQTGNGLIFEHTLICRRDEETEGEVGEPCWNVVVNAVLQETSMPGAYDLELLIKAAYTAAALVVLTDLMEEPIQPPDN